MSASVPPQHEKGDDAMQKHGVRLRLFGATVAMAAGVAALLVAILLVRSVLA